MVSRPSLPRDSRIRAVLVGIGITLLALVCQQLAVIPAFAVDTRLLSEDPAAASRLARTLFLALNFVGLAIGGILYMWATDRGWEWIDLSWPSKRDLLWIAGGIGLVIVFYIGFNILVTLMDIPAADSDVVRFLEDDLVMIGVMIGIVFLLNAPIEEFLFRNVIQKRLYTAFSGVGSVLAASIIFTIIHFPVFYVGSPSLLATLVSLIFLFGGSLIFGYVYLRTGNLLVPIAVHALMNGFVLGLYLLVVMLGLEAEVQAGGWVIGTIL